jgi:hypothetical protein
MSRARSFPTYTHRFSRRAPSNMQNWCTRNRRTCSAHNHRPDSGDVMSAARVKDMITNQCTFHIGSRTSCAVDGCLVIGFRFARV